MEARRVASRQPRRVHRPREPDRDPKARPGSRHACDQRAVHHHHVRRFARHRARHRIALVHAGARAPRSRYRLHPRPRLSGQANPSNGVKKRYGFIYVDRTDDDPRECRRYRKDSLAWYHDVIARNGAGLSL
ncbi:family 1 glycosylhydrolase [Collinsella tanakaei]|nr:family 1 glycosylhydrolase [Collinsella tanakaei]